MYESGQHISSSTTCRTRRRPSCCSNQIRRRYESGASTSTGRTNAIFPILYCFLVRFRFPQCKQKYEYEYEQRAAIRSDVAGSTADTHRGRVCNTSTERSSIPPLPERSGSMPSICLLMRMMLRPSCIHTGTSRTKTNSTHVPPACSHDACSAPLILTMTTDEQQACITGWHDKHARRTQLLSDALTCRPDGREGDRGGTDPVLRSKL